MIRRFIDKSETYMPDTSHLHQVVYYFIKKKKFGYKNSIIHFITSLLINSYNLFIFIFAMQFIYNSKVANFNDYDKYIYIHFIICFSKKKISNGLSLNCAIDKIKLIIIYTILTISIIGYGFLFSIKFTKYNNFQYENIDWFYWDIWNIFLDFNILFTNLVFPHNNLHNLIFIFHCLYYFL